MSIVRKAQLVTALCKKVVTVYRERGSIETLRAIRHNLGGRQNILMALRRLRSADGAPRARLDPRMSPRFNEHASKQEVGAFLAASGPLSAELAIDIVMPTYNRAPLISRAIESVLAQRFQNWKLIIVDDGSTDDTPSVVARFRDPRIIYELAPNAGVSAARNRGVRLGCAPVIAYLDSDNIWRPDYLTFVAHAYNRPDTHHFYVASRHFSSPNKTVGYLYKKFDLSALKKQNYIDLNIYSHRRWLFEALGGFDENLRRVVDWDLILKYSARCVPEQLYVIGCDYFSESAARDRITIAQPFLAKKIVEAKHAIYNGIDYDQDDLFNWVKPRIAIKISAPQRVRHLWGDYHFARALAKQFLAKGWTVRVDCIEGWYAKGRLRDDVTITLRGRHRYKPRPSEINILWQISHPDRMPMDEYQDFDYVLTASLSYLSLLSLYFRPNRLGYLPQAFDDTLFLRSHATASLNGKALFVGSTRNVLRPIIQLAIDAFDRGKLDLEIIGQGWNTAACVAGSIPFEQLAQKYAEGAIVLNDHWDSMFDFGIVSDRVYAALAVNAPVITDDVSGITSLAPRNIVAIKKGSLNEENLGEAVQVCKRQLRMTESELLAFREKHSFKRRAAAFEECIKHRTGFARHVPWARAEDEAELYVRVTELSRERFCELQAVSVTTVGASIVLVSEEQAERWPEENFITISMSELMDVLRDCRIAAVEGASPSLGEYRLDPRLWRSYDEKFYNAPSKAEAILFASSVSAARAIMEKMKNAQSLLRRHAFKALSIVELDEFRSRFVISEASTEWRETNIKGDTVLDRVALFGRGHRADTCLVLESDRGGTQRMADVARLLRCRAVILDTDFAEVGGCHRPTWAQYNALWDGELEAIRNDLTRLEDALRKRVQSGSELEQRPLVGSQSGVQHLVEPEPDLPASL